MPTASAPLQTNTDYWTEAKTPLASLVFLLPLIALYEFGVLMFGQDQADAVRNGADFWMRSLLTRAGLGPVLLPLFVLGGLLTWQLWSRRPWTMKPSTLAGMLGESTLLGIALVAIGQCHDLAFRQITPGDAAAVEVSTAADSHPELQRPVCAIGPVTRAVSFIGAGVYEEVMFRLLLVPAAFVLFRMFEFPTLWASVMAAVSTSFLFALAHHVGPSADAFNLFVFSFRAGAGLFFATVFLLRGFGITVGCHAAYDLLVGVLLAPA